IGAAHGIGSIIGPSLVSFSIFGLMYPLYLAVVLAGLMTLVIWLLLKEPNHGSPLLQIKAPKMRYFDPRYREILAVGVVVYLAMAVTTQLMGFYLPFVLGLTGEAAAAQLAIV